MAEKKIKRFKVKGTSEDGWINGDCYTISPDGWLSCGSGIAPATFYDIEYEQEDPKPKYDKDGMCDYDCPFAGERFDHVDENKTRYTLCSRHGMLMAWAMHHCPDAVVLRGRAGVTNDCR